MEINNEYPTIPTEELNRIVDDMKEFVKEHPDEQSILEDADNIINTFESKHDEWFKTVPFLRDCKPYIDVLLCYSIAINKRPTYQLLLRLESYISEFETNVIVQHGYLLNLYYHLGISWHNLGDMHDKYAVEAFKKYVFYLLGISSHTLYSPTCYSFKKCSTYLYKNLVNEQITLSSPTTFNDPFDSPVIELYENSGDINKLFRAAFLSCVRIACFVCNTFQPYIEKVGTKPIFITQKPKNTDNGPEYTNMLMWSHYADNHKGICIKYHFQNTFSNLYSKPDLPVRYFKDVKYKLKLNSLKPKNDISIEDAFFAKSKVWEYENELRLIQCDLQGGGEHKVVDAPNCIEAIYFGVNCPQTDIDTIMKIMKDKKLVIERLENGKVQERMVERPIEFYKMEYNTTKFGTLKEKKL